MAGDTEAAAATAMIDKHRPNPDDTAVSAAPPEPPLRMPVFTFGTAAVTPREIPVAAVAAPTSSTPSPAIAIRQGGTLFGTEPRASRTDDDFTAAGSSALAPSHVGRRHAWWKVAAGIVLAVLAGVAARRGYMPEGASAAAAPVVRLVTAPVEEKTAPPAPALATLELSSQPAGARVLLDGKEIGQTPLTRADVEPGRHVLTFITASASLNKTVRVKAGETLSVDVPVFSGWLVVFAPIRLDVSENGRGIGSSEDERLLLAPGRHTLTLRNAQLGYSTVETVNILPGEERRLTIAPRGTLNVNAVPWAEVWLDGERLGETPLANLQVPLGTRDIVFKHPEFGERRQTITVAAGAPTAVSVDFSKPPSP